MIGASKNLFDMEIGWKSITHYKRRKKEKNISANEIILMLIGFFYFTLTRINVKNKDHIESFSFSLTNITVVKLEMTFNSLSSDLHDNLILFSI